MPSTYSPSAEDLRLESSGELTNSGSFLSSSQHAQRRNSRKVKLSRQADNTLNGVKVRRDAHVQVFDSPFPEDPRCRLTTPIQEVGPRAQLTESVDVVAALQKLAAEVGNQRVQVQNQQLTLQHQQLAMDQRNIEFRKEKADFKEEQQKFLRAQETFQTKERESQLRLKQLEEGIKAQQSMMKKERSSLSQEKADFQRHKTATEEKHRRVQEEIEAERGCLRDLDKELEIRRRSLEQDREELRRNTETLESLTSSNGERLLDLATLRRQLRELQISKTASEKKLTSLEELRSLVLEQRKKEAELAKKTSFCYRLLNFSPFETAKHLTVEKDLKRTKARLESVLRSTGPC